MGFFDNLFDYNDKKESGGGRQNNRDAVTDAEARRRAMIAAEAREKKNNTKSQTKKSIHKHVTTNPTLFQQQQDDQTISLEPKSEASRRAAEASKRGEANLAAELGYNPYTYESIQKSTAEHQQRAITTTTTASFMESNEIPDDLRFPFHEFEDAVAMILSNENKVVAMSGLKICLSLIRYATTKGQKIGFGSEIFRRIRLSNPEIKAAIVDVPGSLPLMLSVGFELHSDYTNPEDSLLVFPLGFRGPGWLPVVLDQTTAAVATDGGGDGSFDEDDHRFSYHEFEVALATIRSIDDKEVALSGLNISRQLIETATKKGQNPGADEFRTVRLANPKIKAAIVDIPGNLPLMLSVGFELRSDDENPCESLLVYPPGFVGPGWLPLALKSMEDTETEDWALITMADL